jgi:hypothetical protein
MPKVLKWNGIDHYYNPPLTPLYQRGELDFFLTPTVPKMKAGVFNLQILELNPLFFI